MHCKFFKVSAKIGADKAEERALERILRTDCLEKPDGDATTDVKEAQKRKNSRNRLPSTWNDRKHLLEL